ncbi:hypothetical protein PVAP13_5KG463800 [Panicum virgatum]|uniref:Uncharacterized protein n=1 Tax=Panicum virgatum TaxID=38727 RepID=A0A8T0SL04_PANVG|nr:hypothetical protein PVAP13_5KG463800 [Panicum virgatum]
MHVPEIFFGILFYGTKHGANPFPSHPATNLAAAHLRLDASTTRAVERAPSPSRSFLVPPRLSRARAPTSAPAAPPLAAPACSCSSTGAGTRLFSWPHEPIPELQDHYRTARQDRARRGQWAVALRVPRGASRGDARASRLLAISQGHSSRHGVGLLVAVPRACSSAGKKVLCYFNLLSFRSCSS